MAVKKKKRNLVKVFNTQEQIKSYLEFYKHNYRPYDPGGYLYNELMKMNFNDKFKNIELIYVTLSAWNMNSRGAKLSDFNQFKKSLLKHKSLIKSINEYKVGEKGYENIFVGIENIFDSLDLVAKNKPKLVTFSKTLHFLLPLTIVPIDRRYTLKFFTGNTNFAHTKQLELFKSFHQNFHEFALQMNLKNHLEKEKVGSTWTNTNVPKVIDNLIIGYMRKKKI